MKSFATGLSVRFFRVTMPIGTFRKEERGDKYKSYYYVGDPELWRPLLDQIAADYAAEHAAAVQRFAEREPQRSEEYTSELQSP